MNRLFFLAIFLFSELALAGQFDYLVYQKDSDIELALKFIGTPSERIPTTMPLVRGSLAKQELLDFSNKIIEARETKNVPLFKSLIHQESLDNSKDMLNAAFEQIQDGSLIYGNENYKYFVTSNPIPDRHIIRFFKKNNNKPSITLMFYHYHPSNSALIGSPTYLIKTNDGFKIVLPIR